MWDKFGEFDSAEEINRAAAAQRDEGDKEALLALAKENGIDQEDAEDYAEGILEELTTPLLAALGKLKLEKEDLKLGNVLLDWVEELEKACQESPGMAAAVRKKGKDLAGYIARLADEGFEHKATVSKQIVAKTQKVKGFVGSHDFAIGVPDKATRARIMREYYLGEGAGK